jgi:hypothetical protein
MLADYLELDDYSPYNCQRHLDNSPDSFKPSDAAAVALKFLVQRLLVKT